MEQPDNSSLFGLSIDPNSKLHLAEAARWGKFLSIVGFVVCGLMIIIGLFFGTIFGSLMNSAPYRSNDAFSSMGAGLGAVVTVFYIIIALIWFFPCLFLYRFSAQMKMALTTNDQDKLNGSFQNLKAMLRYIGIIMIIVLVIWLLGFLGLLAGASSM